jgi:hypothetical protein
VEYACFGKQCGGSSFHRIDLRVAEACGPWSTDTAANGNLRSIADVLAGLPSNSSGAVIVQGDLQRDYYQNSFDWWAPSVSRRS